MIEDIQFTVCFWLCLSVFGICVCLLEMASVKSAKGAKGAKADSPKRPLTSYMMFAQEHREKAKASHPEAKSNDIAKILGSWWKEADEEVKQEFKEKAQSALDKFNGKDVEVVSPKKVKKVEVEVEKVEPPKKEKGNKSKK